MRLVEKLKKAESERDEAETSKRLAVEHNERLRDELAAMTAARDEAERKVRAWQEIVRQAVYMREDMPADWTLRELVACLPREHWPAGIPSSGEGEA